MDHNISDEISYREELLARVRNKEKLSTQERLWLSTHRTYNFAYGYPYVNTDVIPVCPNIWYNVQVKLLFKNDEKIIPVFSAPNGEGKIVADVFDDLGEKCKKTVKMLGLLIDQNSPSSCFEYISKTGFLTVNFQCHFFEKKQRLYIRKLSSSGDPRFAMLCRASAPNLNVYYCKAPLDNEFESMIFSVEWTKKGQGDGSLVPSRGQGDGSLVPFLP